MPLRRTRGEQATGLEAIPAEALERLVAIGEDTLDLDDRVALSQMVRHDLGAAGAELDRHLLQRICTLGESFESVRRAQAALKDLLERYQVGPWYPGVFLALVETTVPPRALVLQGSARRVVGIAEEVDVGALAAGDEVYLDDERGLLVAKSPFGLPPSAETATFERALADGRLLLRWRDELVVAAPAAVIPVDELEAGDLVRWDHGMGMAFERLERHINRRFLLENVPDLVRDRVGGQDENLARLLDALTSTLVDPARARRYGLKGRQAVLLIGPPGSGKTLMARIAAAEIDRLTGKRCRIAVVKPAEFDSMWVGESERGVRECFRALREAAGDGYAVLSLDEVESLGRTRGGAGGRHDDKLLAALLAEIDGFSDRTNIAIVAATNRKDLIDGALLERLSDVEIHVGRPNMAGARRIFEIHLPAELPYAGDGNARAVLIDRAVSRLYSPNGDNALAVLRFRNGVTRTITARDLMSGRSIEQLCQDACRAALRHDLRSGEVGLTTGDLDDALAATLEKLATTLTPRNCRAYLDDLPQDVDVVSVERIVRPVPRRHDYVNAA